jgi:hypothetical protein
VKVTGWRRREIDLKSRSSIASSIDQNHCDEVLGPEPVWRLFEYVLPRAPNLSFSAPPKHVLAALVLDTALRATCSDRWDVVVLPGRPPRWRVVDSAESQLLESCRAPQSVGALRAAGVSEVLLSRLIAEGALEAVEPATKARTAATL